MVKRWAPADAIEKSAINTAIVGKRNRGKSHVLIQIAHEIDQKRLLPKAAVLSSTDGVTGFFRKYFNDAFIYTDFNEETLTKIMDVQAKLVAKNKDPRKTGLLLIVDDSGFDQGFFKSRPFRELAMNGRHYNITTLVALQDIGSFTPAIRAQLDFVCCLNESFTTGLERLYKWIFGTYETLNDFKKAHELITRNFGCHVFDNVSQGSNEDKILWYKSKHPLPRFKFGSAEYQSFKKKKN
jgi:hypothetical protein